MHIDICYKSNLETLSDSLDLKDDELSAFLLSDRIAYFGHEYIIKSKTFEFAGNNKFLSVIAICDY